jgi:hypothetical protein
MLPESSWRAGKYALPHSVRRLGRKLRVPSKMSAKEFLERFRMIVGTVYLQRTSIPLMLRLTARRLDHPPRPYAWEHPFAVERCRCVPHQQAWEQFAVSPELRNLASCRSTRFSSGFSLWKGVARLDRLTATAGHRINIFWQGDSRSGLSGAYSLGDCLYPPTFPIPTPDRLAMGLLGTDASDVPRFTERIAVSGGSKAQGGPQKTRALYLRAVCTGELNGEEVGNESIRQRQEWQRGKQSAFYSTRSDSGKMRC